MFASRKSPSAVAQNGPSVQPLRSEEDRNRVDHLAAEAYRRKCFERQVKYLAPVMVPGAGAIAVAIVVQWFVGLCATVDTSAATSALICLVVATNPELLPIQKSVTPYLRERVAVAGLTGFVVLMRIGIYIWKVPLPVYMHGIGVSAMMLKVFLMNLCIPERDFLILNVLDSILWTLNSFSIAMSLPEGGWFFALWQLIVTGVPFAMTSALRRLPMMTLSESDSDTQRETKQRLCAENERDVFLSYLMHEMRNPLSGASLLVFEFRESLKELSRISQDPQFSLDSLRKTTKSEALRLRQLASFMATHFTRCGACVTTFCN
uniref:Uncharacterized protein n=1 Tax=Chromera velia CCMP2878 TaxID=1169474 RepID=A0A0G4I5T2_9ALVE|eukprot:Cvel_11226.t1-p1 / transcript=Cvel_11226.t1 / gene=Cvel_11226 / organism=Chromera_velia_CCMP2878 / gene_product=hypothetical protein / transcript_product=hypothetical protein / location=Cvel_scaffold698:56398-57903(-) / protein_length=319 / sequence_SO=supercontig / SO=protein_coding / is_pseudo=false